MRITFHAQFVLKPVCAGMLRSQYRRKFKQMRLNNLIEQSHLFELPPVLRAEHAGADRFQYKLRVKGDSHEHSVELDEAAMPPNLRPLINWVMASKRKA